MTRPLDNEDATGVSVAEFLTEVLRPAPESVAWVTAFTAPPENGDWGGSPRAPAAVPVINGANAYYSIAAFPPHAQHRRIEQALGAAVVLCDDIGSKADAATVLALFGEPSFKIHTSARSQQWGYFLTRLATNAEIGPIHKRLVQLKLCDESGNNLVRYGRLPAGINNKKEYAEPYQVNCVDWHPERRFRVEQIAEALSATGAEQRPMASIDEDEFETLAALITSGESYHDPLIRLAAKFAARGVAPADIMSLLKARMLVSEDRSARWQARYDSIEECVKSAVKKYAPPERGDKILLRQGAAREAVDAALGVLSQRGISANIFARGKDLVIPHLAKAKGFDDEPVQSLELTTVSPAALAYELNGLVNFQGFDKHKNLVAKDCPSWLANTVLAIPHKWTALPVLERIALAPIYLGAGQLLAAPGYHAKRTKSTAAETRTACSGKRAPS